MPANAQPVYFYVCGMSVNTAVVKLSSLMYAEMHTVIRSITEADV